MKNKKDIIDKNFKMVWAYMPLSAEEMRKIDFRHQVRPYLLFMEKKDFFYVFPSTSQICNSKICRSSANCKFSADNSFA